MLPEAESIVASPAMYSIYPLIYKYSLKNKHTKNFKNFKDKLNKF